MSPSQPSQDLLRTLGVFSRRTAIPKGTTDVVMDRLFPQTRSQVPLDEERRRAVYEILVIAGVLQEGEVEFHAPEAHGEGEEGRDVREGQAAPEAQAQGPRAHQAQEEVAG